MITARQVNMNSIYQSSQNRDLTRSLLDFILFVSRCYVKLFKLFSSLALRIKFYCS